MPARVLAAIAVMIIGLGAGVASGAVSSGAGGGASAAASTVKPKPKKKARKPARCTTKKKSSRRNTTSRKTTTTARTAGARAAAATTTATSKNKTTKKKSSTTCRKPKKKAKKKPAPKKPTPPTTTVPTTPNEPPSTPPDTTPTTPAPPAYSLKVNFQTATTTTPAGYLPDFGQAFDAGRGYGWVDASSGAPVDLVGNGRERNVDADKRLDTFMSMQLTPSSPGVHTPGSWKAVVPNGTYAVTIAVGDPSFADSNNILSVEGQPAMNFTPSASNLHETTTTRVTVSDGTLDVSAAGGNNTKIDYVAVAGVDAVSPYVTAIGPIDGAAGTCTDASITAQLSDGVNPTTANAAGLKLLAPGGGQVSGFYNVDGAYSNATFVPASPLQPNTTYTIQVTNSLKTPDPNGRPYTPFTSTFTTGNAACHASANVTLTRSTFDDGSKGLAPSTNGPTAMALGPDPSSPTQLWVAFGNGDIFAYTLDPATGQATGAPTEVANFKFNRVVSGLRFDPSSTGSSIKLWVSNGQFGCDLAAIGVACDDFTGAVSTLTGSSPGSLTKTDIVTGLPRSVGNHMNNGIDFGPDGALYLAQGAENGYGAPDSTWGNRSEDLLSAAILRIDVAAISSPPLSVNTTPGPGAYDPAAPGAPVTLYATGTRNPFSVLWHSNGKLYAPVNESSNGNTPADPGGPGGGAPALTNLDAFDDYFTEIVQGKYYGHPNPARGEYRLNGGNPTSGIDPFEVPAYPVGTQPNTNWRQPDLDLGLHRSADGSAEFKSNVFGTNLQGQILVTEYSQGKDVIAVKLNGSGTPISTSVVATGFYNPLPITVDNATGRIYVGEYGHDPDGANGQITLLTPH